MDRKEEKPSTSSSMVLSDIDITDLESCLPPKFYSDTKITFFQTKLCYDRAEDIVARFYSIGYDLQNGDSIGIGVIQNQTLFTSKPVSECNDVSIPVEEEFFTGDSNNTGKSVTFKYEEDFPEAVRENVYFQFYYMNTDGEILGASTPFRFQHEIAEQQPSGDDITEKVAENLSVMDNGTVMVEKMLDDDFIVIRPQESFFQERIEHLTKSNNLLQFLIRKMEKELAEKEIGLQKTMNELKEVRSELSSTLRQSSTAHSELMEKYQHLKQRAEEMNGTIETHKLDNQKLVEELGNSQTELANLKAEQEKSKDSLMNAQEVQVILRDKEEEIDMLRDMVKNLETINKTLASKKETLEVDMDTMKSSLANLLNERRDLIGENASILSMKELECDRLKAQIEKLELANSKQSTEVKELEVDLKKAVDNLKNINSKFQVERDSLLEKQKQNILAKDKLQFDLISMRAQLEQSRVEYANLYRKFQFCSKKLQSQKVESDSIVYPTLPSDLSSLSSVASIKEENTAMVIDDTIDAALQQLEVESAEEPMVVPTTTIDPASSSQMLIEISDDSMEPSAPPAAAEANTDVKRIATTSSDSGDTFVKMPCIMCPEVIMCRQRPGHSGQLHEMIDHLESVHKQRMCPICSILFDTSLRYSDSYFNLHLSNHFNDKRK